MVQTPNSVSPNDVGVGAIAERRRVVHGFRRVRVIGGGGRAGRLSASSAAGAEVSCGGDWSERLTAVLAAEVRKLPKAEEYRTAGTHHLAIVLWGRGAHARAAALDRWAGCSIWSAPGPDGAVCAWLGRQSPLCACDMDRLVSHLGDWHGGASFGCTAFDSEGFLRSQRQALTAYAVARVCGDTRLRYHTAQFAILLASDREQATEYVRQVLGPLNAIKPRWRARLLTTLQTYIAHGHRLSRTAQICKCDRETVRRHLREIRETLGREVDTNGAELLAALRLQRLLGIELE